MLLTFKPNYRFAAVAQHHQTLASDWMKLGFGLPEGSTQIHLSHVGGGVPVSVRAHTSARGAGRQEAGRARGGSLYEMLFGGAR